MAFDPTDLVCPITLELPFDPVTAEDGRVYERSAIEEHIATQGRRNGRNLKSPMTNAPMGDRLYPAPQHKNLIEALIRSGVLKGDLVYMWNEKVDEKRAAEELLKKANNGDAEAMCDVGTNYLFGYDGFKQDSRLAHIFYGKAHDAGDVLGTALLGQCYLFGDGVFKCERQGLLHVGTAAGKGSVLAAWILAQAYAHGHYGMGVNEKEAIRWLWVVVEGNFTAKDLSHSSLKEAQELLDKLMGYDMIDI